MSDKPRILLVDDEPSISKVVSKRLEVAGFEVTAAMDGQEALLKAQSQSPDLIILDLMLPKMNGYEVCSMLKGDPRYQKIPIVIFSAKAQEKDEKLGRECGADAYVTKPFDPETLIQKIRSLLPTPPTEPAVNGPGA